MKFKFALVDGIRAEATKGAKGICPNCGSELIAKCGEVKLHHWAHKRIRNCDPWWENETEWHRLWKNNFEVKWQEACLTDGLTGEKHFADVRTDHGLVIEFQHSHIDPQERRARENYYKNMVWVVDGTRLTRDYPRFLKGREEFRNANNQGFFFVEFLEECVPSAWLESAVPVIFDFRGTESIHDPNDIRNHLHCLFPKQAGRCAMLVQIRRETFIESAINGKWLLWVRNLMDKLGQGDQPRHNPIANQPVHNRIKRRESQYILERGRWKKRRRL